MIYFQIAVAALIISDAVRVLTEPLRAMMITAFRRKHSQMCIQKRGNRMIRVTAATFAALLFAGEAHAALSGFWETSRVLHAILGSNELADSLKQQPVESIVSIDGGYQIKSHSCTVEVRVDRTPQDKPAPSTFQFTVGKSVCQ